MFFAYLCALLKGVIYGTTTFFTGRLTESTDVLDVLALRFLLSFAVMWLLKTLKIIKVNVGVKQMLCKSERPPLLKNLVLTALFEPVLYILFETLGVSMTSDITVAVILSLAPVVYCICEELMLKEKSTPLQKVFLGCGIFGAIYISVNSTSTNTGEDSILGIVFLFSVLVTGALFCVFSRKSSKGFSSMEITYVSCMLGALSFNCVNIVRHAVKGNILHYFDPYFNIENLIGFVVLGIFSTIIATAMNNYSLSKMQVSTLSAFGGISTVVTIVIGVVFGGEHLHLYHYIGLPFIFLRMIGVSAISIMKDRKSKNLNAKCK